MVKFLLTDSLRYCAKIDLYMELFITPATLIEIGCIFWQTLAGLQCLFVLFKEALFPPHLIAQAYKEFRSLLPRAGSYQYLPQIALIIFMLL